MRSTLLMIVLAVATLSVAVAEPGVTWAQDAPRFNYSVTNKLLEGQKATVRVQVDTAMRVINVKLTRRSDGKVFEMTRRDVAADTPVEFSWDHGGGTREYAFAIDGTAVNGGTIEGETSFTIEAVESLNITVHKDRADLAGGHIYFSASRPVREATLSVYGEGPALIQEHQQAYNGRREDLQISWEVTEAPIIYMDLKVTDEGGFWKIERLTPFSVHIPHEEVVFESSSDAIRASERPKLDASYALVRENLDKYGADLTLDLYVAGYTDTVGSDADNQRLSEQRARAIARYFRDKGLETRIFYQGFGEDALAVQTADSTDEPRNRRALYILSNTPPARSADLPRGRWKPLR